MTRILLSLLLASLLPASLARAQAPAPDAKTEPAAAPPTAPAPPAAALLTDKGLVPGCRFHSKKLKQVACINGFMEEGTGAWHSFEVLAYSGDPVQSLPIDDTGKPAGRQSPDLLKRANEVLASGGFEPLVEAAFPDPGTMGPEEVTGLAVKVEVREATLGFVDAKGRKFLKVKLPVERPHVPRIASLGLIPGTRFVAITIRNDPGTLYGQGFNVNWSSLVVKVP